MGFLFEGLGRARFHALIDDSIRTNQRQPQETPVNGQTTLAIFFCSLAALTSCSQNDTSLGRGADSIKAGTNVCQQASDCKGGLIADCRQCANGQFGCAHFSCTANKCTVAYCD